MIRNHLIDPQHSQKVGGTAFFNPGSYDQQQNGSPSKPTEDLWYTSNGRESPMYSSYNSSAGGFTANDSQTTYGSSMTMGGGDPIEDDFENEPPLLEELGIRFDHIWAKTQAVINIKQEISEHILDDTDLAGPLCFCLLLGSCLLLSGKIQFGYIYGFSVFGCLGMHFLINLLHHTPIDFWVTASVLGYCILPVVALAAFHIVFSLQTFFGLLLSASAIAWATFSATRLFHAKFHLNDQYWLVAYPCMLLYSCFVLITVF